MEIPLCGHATLAAAKVLFEKVNLNDVSFKTDAGLGLAARRVGDQIEMVFPVYDTVPADVPSALLSALGIDAALIAFITKKRKFYYLKFPIPPL